MKSSRIVLLALCITLLASVVFSSSQQDCVRKCREDGRKLFSCRVKCAQLANDDENSDEAPAVVVDSQLAWLKYRSALIHALTSKTESNMQIFTVPEEANWDIDPEQFTRLADAVPFASGFYERSGFTVRSQYSTFLRNINAGRQIIDAGAKAQLDQLEKAFQTDSESIQGARTQCWKSFKDSKSALKLDEYEKQNCPTYLNAQEKLQDTQYLIEFYTTKAYGENNTPLLESRFETRDTSLMKFFERTGRLADFRKDIAAGRGRSLSISFSTQDSKDRKENYSSYANGIRRPSSMTGSLFTLIAGKNAAGVTTTTDKFSLKLNLKAWKRIDIQPDSWLRRSVIEQFSKGPWIHPNQTPNYFGAGGSLTLLPKSVYVAYQPSVELMVNKEDAFRLKSAMSQGKSGFFSSKSTTATIETNIVSSDTYKVSIRSNSPEPQIIAMDFWQLPEFK